MSGSENECKPRPVRQHRRQDDHRSNKSEGKQNPVGSVGGAMD